MLEQREIDAHQAAPGRQLSLPEVLEWLTERFADWLEKPADELDPNRAIASYGLDSINAVTLSVQLEDALGIELDSAVLWDRPTILSLAEHLRDKLNAAGVADLPNYTSEPLST